MSASYASHQAREVKNLITVEQKLDKLAEAVDHLARALGDIERKVNRLS